MRSRQRRSLRDRHAFLNVPYDPNYEPLLLAFLAGLCGFGLIPKATVEIPGSKRRLNRILDLIRRCRYSFHDLSRVELDPKLPRTPRFNMPFELGLAVALAALKDRGHRWFVFEAVPHRAWKSLSDIAGTDVYIHEGRPAGVVRQLANALTRRGLRPSVSDLEQIYEELRSFAARLKDVQGGSLFEARAFRDLVYAGHRIARSHLRRRRSKPGSTSCAP
jgi:hypothetical protein